MSHRSNLTMFPASRRPVALLAVDRAVSELRRGRIIAVRAGGDRVVLVMAAESASYETLADIAGMGRDAPYLAITARRAAVLGLAHVAGRVATLRPKEKLRAKLVHDLADPLADLSPDDAARLAENLAIAPAGRHGCDAAAVALAKVARLLPAVVLVELRVPDGEDLEAWAARHGVVVVDAGDVFQHEQTTARTLNRVSEADVPLMDAERTRIIAFRPHDGGIEHLAIVIGDPQARDAVLTRLHSECFTGDLLGSLRCDCGDQLRGAITEIAATGGGVLLYLAQEGRGIGLVNKLRAYELQDRGFDTLDANEQLGFDDDERVYIPAAEMLRQLGFSRVRLLTNNPAKVEALAAYGVEVVERVPHAFPSNRHNEAYLRTKATRSGHLF
ncbi:MAG: GTP cyclohydrolase II [Hyphomicrobiales bacterium]|nr:GTP cyclohydrolase II [Hyphomicrobiales bacterium]